MPGSVIAIAVISSPDGDARAASARAARRAVLEEVGQADVVVQRDARGRSRRRRRSCDLLADDRLKRKSSTPGAAVLLGHGHREEAVVGRPSANTSRGDDALAPPTPRCGARSPRRRSGASSRGSRRARGRRCRGARVASGAFGRERGWAGRCQWPGPSGLAAGGRDSSASDVIASGPRGGLLEHLGRPRRPSARRARRAGARRSCPRRACGSARG